MTSSVAAEYSDEEERASKGNAKKADGVPEKKDRKGRKRSRPRSKRRPKRRSKKRRRRSASTAKSDRQASRDRVRRLSNALADETQGREEFGRFEDSEFELAAGYFAKYGFLSVEDIRKAKARSRDFFIEDLRAEHLAINDLRLVLEIFELFPPMQKNRSVENPEFEEICIPVRMKTLSLCFEQLGGILRPDQQMVNAVSIELAKALATNPAYTPFVIPDLAKRPWAPAAADRGKAVESWAARMKNFKSGQQLSFQAWLLYLLRFLIAADVCKAWDTFGGLIAQLNRLGIVLNLAVTENVPTALLYDSQLRAHIADLARQRSVNVDYATLLAEENIAVKRQVLKDLSENHHKKQPQIRSRNSFQLRPRPLNNQFRRGGNNYPPQIRPRRDFRQGNPNTQGISQGAAQGNNPAHQPRVDHPGPPAENQG